MTELDQYQICNEALSGRVSFGRPMGGFDSCICSAKSSRRSPSFWLSAFIADRSRMACRTSLMALTTSISRGQASEQL